MNDRSYEFTDLELQTIEDIILLYKTKNTIKLEKFKGDKLSEEYNTLQYRQLVYTSIYSKGLIQQKLEEIGL